MCELFWEKIVGRVGVEPLRPADKKFEYGKS